MVWYVAASSISELVEGGRIAISGETKGIRKMYVAHNGERHLFFVAEDTKEWSDDLSASETRDVVIRRFLTRDESVTLSDFDFDRTIEDRGVSRSWQDGLTASETRNLDVVGLSFSRDDTASLIDDDFDRNITEQAPDAPSNVSATASGTDTIDVTWTDNSSNEDNFRVQRRNIDTGSSYSTVDTPGANSTSYQDTGLSDDTTYQYRVRAENTGGSSSYSQSNQETTDVAETGPENLTVSYSSNACEFQLSWDPNETNQQEIWACAGTSCSPNNQIDTVAAGVGSYNDDVTSLALNDARNYEIRSVDGTSNQDSATKVIECAS